MSTTAILHSLDGMTVPELAGRMRANVDIAAQGCMKAGAKEALLIINHEGHKHYVRNRARKPVHLSAKLGPHSPKVAIVYGIPAGFWSIVEKGSKAHQIRPKKKKSKKGQTPLLRTPYGPRPYVLHPGHGSLGHPWEAAMVRVNHIPNHVFEPSLDAAFKGIFK